MLSHPHIVGTLELSTAYTWTSAEESLKVCTSKGIYRLSQMEKLTFEPKPSTILGVYSEIQSFITSIKHGHSSVLTDITTIKPTYEVIMSIIDRFL